MPATPTRPVSAATPTVLAIALSASAVLSVGARLWDVAPSPRAWLLAGAVSLVAGWLATLRRRLPVASGRPVGWLWLLACSVGAASHLRHALDAVVEASWEFPTGATVLPGWSLGEATVGVALLLALVPPMWLGALRRRRPRLALVASSGLAGVAIAALGWRTPRVVGAAPGFTAVGLACSLAWTAALVGPATLPLRSRWTFFDRTLPRLGLLLGGGALVGVGAVRKPLGVLLLHTPGARWMGNHALHWAGVVEALVCIAGAAVVLVLGARVASRSLPQLRTRSLFGLLLAVLLLVSWVPAATLLALSGVLGWAAVACGAEAAAWVPAGAALVGGREHVLDGDGGA